MRVVADFHFHSKYSRAVSKQMVPETITEWAKLKGLGVVGTSDCTHPFWVNELKQKLVEAEEGLYRMKDMPDSPRFIISGEVSSIFTQGGKGRRIHTFFMVPNWEILDKINTRLSKLGKVYSDGRPIFGVSAKDIAKIILDASPDCLVVPAHIWTPWFSLFGSMSGFNSVAECYGEITKNIYAVETGLSSDPAMNWRISGLDKLTLLSNSDAHSPMNMMREGNVFDLPELSYMNIIEAIRKKDMKRFLYTIEYFPQEGMYHWDGHRAHNISMSPEEAEKLNDICPECGKRMTIGVEHRVHDLADRPAFTDDVAGKPAEAPDWGILYKNLMPLDEIIAEALGVNTGTKKVANIYYEVVRVCGSEFAALIDKSREELEAGIDKRVAEGIMRVREGNVKIKPGYDGVYGEVKIFDEDEAGAGQPQQGSLF